MSKAKSTTTPQPRHKWGPVVKSYGYTRRQYLALISPCDRDRVVFMEDK